MRAQRCILVGGEKGGTGKSTIATNLATMLKLAGLDTHLVDCDKQLTSLKFTTRRTAQGLVPPLVCTHVAGNQLQVPLADLAEKYDAVIIDCGGQDSVELRSAMIAPCVDLLLIPVQAGYFDLETLVTMDQLVQTSHIYNPRLVARCLINRAPTHAHVSVAEEARAFITDELPQLGVLDTILHDRISYSYAVAKGEAVVEYEQRTKRDGKATAEMLALYHEVMQRPFTRLPARTPQSMEYA
ncbi:MAG: division plane positioning ATPase MipZ [Candidatus Tectimicrobiota bacterium]